MNLLTFEIAIPPLIITLILLVAVVQSIVKGEPILRKKDRKGADQDETVNFGIGNWIFLLLLQLGR